MACRDVRASRYVCYVYDHNGTPVILGDILNTHTGVGFRYVICRYTRMMYAAVSRLRLFCGLLMCDLVVLAAPRGNELTRGDKT